MDHHQRLQIAADAGPREVKRAYARLLKKTRPDEDAAAFQQLHEAYEFCLAYALQYRDEDSDTDAQMSPSGLPTFDPVTSQPLADVIFADELPATVATPMVASVVIDSTPIPTDDTQDDAPVPEQSFNADDFHEQLYQLLADPDPARMRTWLYAQEALYSVNLKHALRHRVVHVIDNAPTCYHETVVVLIEFFGLDQIDRDGLAEQVDAILEVRRTEHELDRIVRKLHDGPHFNWVERLYGHELTSSKNPLRRIFLLVLPTAPSRLGGVLRQIHQIQPDLHHPGLDAGAITFWRQVLDLSALQRPRIVAALLRTILWPVAFFATLWLLVGKDINHLTKAFAKTAGILTALWFAYALVRIYRPRIDAWGRQRLRLPEHTLFSVILIVAGLALLWVFKFQLGILLAVLGLIMGYLWSLRSGSRWLAMITIAAAASIAFSTSLISNKLGSEFRAEHSIALTLSLLSLPLFIQIWMARSEKWSQRIPWVPAVFATALVILSRLF